MTGTMPLETKTKTTTTTEMTTMKLTRRVTTIGDVTCSHRHWHKHSSSYQQQQQPWSSKRLCVLFFVLQLQQHAILPDYVCTNLHTYRYGVVCGSIINKITSTCALVCSMFGVHCLQQTQSILKQRDKIRHTHRHICTCERTKQRRRWSRRSFVCSHFLCSAEFCLLLLLFDRAPFYMIFGRKLLRCTLLLATAIGTVVQLRMYIHMYVRIAHAQPTHDGADNSSLVAARNPFAFCMRDF